MVEAGDRLGLAQDAAGVGAGYLLDRHLALEALVERPVDRSHAPRSNPVDDAEPFHHELTHHFRSSFAVRGPDPPSMPQGFVRWASPGQPPGQRSYSPRWTRTVSAFNAWTGG